MKIIKIILVISILSIPSLFSQGNFKNGFIITIDKDTVYGKVDYRSDLKNYNSCIFKGVKGEIEYFPNQIHAFGYVNDKFFTSQIIRDSFVEVLLEGEISLYRSKNKFHLKKGETIYDLESIPSKVAENGKIKEQSKWRGIINYLTGDCLENTIEIIAKLKLEEKNLTTFILKYNKCRGATFNEYKSNKPWVKFQFGLTLGVSKSEITVRDKSVVSSYLDDSYNSFVPHIGVLVDISLPRSQERVSFQGEIQLSKSSYSSLVKLNQTTTQYHDTFINLNTLSIPLSLKYSFPRERHAFYLQGGVNYDYNFNSDTKLLSEIISENVVNTYPEVNAFEIEKNQVGFWGGFGISKSYKKLDAGITIRYFLMPNLNRTGGFKANNNKITINLILLKK